jgi:hypothetical protein
MSIEIVMSKPIKEVRVEVTVKGYATNYQNRRRDIVAYLTEEPCVTDINNHPKWGLMYSYSGFLIEFKDPTKSNTVSILATGFMKKGQEKEFMDSLQRYFLHLHKLGVYLEREGIIEFYNEVKVLNKLY